MEISRLGDAGLKIKTKNVTVAVDPTVKADADVVISLDRLLSLNTKDKEGVKLLITGPGEYEVSGLSITAEKVGQDVMYRLDDESFGLILASSRIAASAKEEEGEQALVIKLIEPIQTGLLDSYIQDVCVVFGTQENLPKESPEIKRASKINLRKLDEFKGSIVILAKE